MEKDSERIFLNERSYCRKSLLLSSRVQQVVLSRKTGDSTARFLLGPLALTPEPVQQKQRAAVTSGYLFSEKGHISTLQIRIFNLKFLPDQILSRHILGMFAFSSPQGALGAKGVRYSLHQVFSTCTFGRAVAPVSERWAQVKSFFFLYASDFRAAMYYHRADLGHLIYFTIALF